MRAHHLINRCFPKIDGCFLGLLIYAFLMFGCASSDDDASNNISNEDIKNANLNRANASESQNDNQWNNNSGETPSSSNNTAKLNLGEDDKSLLEENQPTKSAAPELATAPVPAPAPAQTEPTASVVKISDSEQLPTHENPSGPCLFETTAGKKETCMLWWVGYDLNRKNRKLKIELLTKGRPQFDIFEEKNQSSQPELVVRFYHTKIRPQMRRPLDASEFRSPVGFIRTRVEHRRQSVDVVLTMRDMIKPVLVARRGNVELTFDVPEKYFATTRPLQNPEYRAESLMPDAILPSASPGSDLPLNQRIGKTVLPEHIQQKIIHEDEKSENNKNSDAPNSLQNSGAQIIEERFSLFSVAQDGPTPDALPAASEPTTEGSAAENEDLTGAGTDEQNVKNYTGKPVVLEFYNAPLGEVLKAFSDQIGTNFIFSPSIASIPVSIKLKKVPWDAALDAILETYQLGMARVSENVIRIDRIDEMGAYLSQRDKAQQIKVLSETRKVLVVRLSNANANDEMASRLRNFFQMNGVDNRTSISVDSRTNTVFIEAPPVILARAKSLIERLDVPEPQVEVVSRLIEVSRQASNFLGISWNGGVNFDPARGLGFGSLNFPNAVGSSFSVDPGVNQTSTVGGVNFNIGSINDSIDIGLRLKMEESKGTTEILQSNRILVADRSNATISAGQTAYFKISQGPVVIQPTQQQGGNQSSGGSGAGSAGVTSRDFTLNLQVTPEVTNDGNVRMRLTISSEVPSVESIPGADVSTNRRQLTTILKKRSGETAVIGGIYDTRKVQKEVGIPVLSRLPIIGALFRMKSFAEAQTEMMMLITPTVVGKSGEALPSGNSTMAEPFTPKPTQPNSGTSNTSNTTQDNQEGVM